MNRRSAHPPARPRRVARPPHRRGVLLLVVLSMLVLFLLVGTTFLVVSGQYRTASKVVEKANRTTFQPADLLERALMQLVRDTRSANSALRYHSLLRDLYGVDGFVGRTLVNASLSIGFGQPGTFEVPPNTIAIAPRFVGVDPIAAPNAANNALRGATNGQFVEFYVADVQDNAQPKATRLSDNNAVGIELDAEALPVEIEISSIRDAYKGALLTFLEGPCAGSTVRVVSYEHITRNVNGTTVGNVAKFVVTVPARRDRQPLTFGPLPVATGQTGVTGQTAIQELIDDGTRGLGVRFLVNGRPFNGAGVGYNALALSWDLENATPAARNSALEVVRSPLMDTPFEFAEVALSPNAAYFDAFRSGAPAGSRTNVFTKVADGDFRFLTQRFADDSGNTADPESHLLYRDFAGPGDTDESYDAPDFQNMALAAQPLERRLRGRVVDPAVPVDPNDPEDVVDPDTYYATGAGEPAPLRLDLDGVPIPSLHRPALANFWFHRLHRSAWLSGLVANPSDRVRAILEPFDVNDIDTDGDRAEPNPRAGGLTAEAAAQIAAIKRKFLMRPLREDHPDFDGGNELSRYGTPAMRNALSNYGHNNDGLNNDRLDNDDALVRDNPPNGEEITFPFWEAVGPWDVDNDSDGVADSVWVDIGLPVQQTEDGRWYKPLVALLVEDLDGRLNLNAHGSAADLVNEDLDPSDTPTDDLNANLAQDYQNPGALFSSNQLAQGEGWGPAEVSLRPVLSPSLPLDELLGVAAGGTPPNGSVNPLDVGFAGNPQYDDYARVLFGRPDPTQGQGRSAAAEALRVAETFGRYGSAVGSTNALALTGPGRTFYPDPAGAPGTLFRDPLTPLESAGFPTFTNAVPEAPSGFGSPPDLRSRYAGAGLTAAGAPLAEPVYEANAAGPAFSWRENPANAVDDSPYEIDLSTSARRLPPVGLDAVLSSYSTSSPLTDDAPFSPAELERLLRAFDADAQSLPARLWNTVDAFDPAKLVAAEDVAARVRAGASVDNVAFAATSLQDVVAASQGAINRRLVTTDSWDLPVPNENWTDRLVLGADGLPGIPWSDTNTDGARNNGDAGNDDSDSLLDEGDEAIVAFDATGSHTFSDGAVVAYDLMADSNANGLPFEAGECDDYVVVMRANPPTSARITDYLRYRVVLELKRQRIFGAAVPHTDPALAAAVNRILFGDNAVPAGDARLASDLASFGGLLAPEVLAGRRMDLNRAFGDGRDNNGNGVVDEPAEAGEPYTFDSTLPGGALSVTAFDDQDLDTRLLQDLDADGVLYVDTDSDGAPDRFDPDDLADRDRNGDGTLDGDREPIVDHVWIDDDSDGDRDADEFRPFDYTRGADANGRGALVGGDRVRDDAQVARQLYARHLYCLMLLLMDENYLAPYDPRDPQVRHYIDPLSGETVPNLLTINRLWSSEQSEAFRIAAELFATRFGVGGQGHTEPRADAAEEIVRLGILNTARQRAMRKLTRRMVAQWAINAVDFRDPDATQTPFEYDENPWDGWNVVNWARGDFQDPADDTVTQALPLDGDLTTDEVYLQRRTVAAGAFSAPSPDATVPANDPNGIKPGATNPTDRTRGVVWGAERPEVLLTEGIAWHDRRLDDVTRTVGDDPDDKEDGLVAAGGDDDDLDQLRKPKGHVFLEATNPWVGDTQRPRELYSSVDVTRDPTTGLDVTANVTAALGVRLDRVSDLGLGPADLPQGATPPVPKTPQTLRSPVWRVAVIEEHPLLRNTTIPDSLRSQAAASVSDDAVDGVTGPGANVRRHLGMETSHGPWVYRSDRTGATAGTAPIRQLDPLPKAYMDLIVEQNEAAVLALLATPELAASFNTPQIDADGLPVAVGVIERAPTLPDPSFPTFDPWAQPAGRNNTPGAFAQSQLYLSSTIDNPGVDTLTRQVMLKPTTFLERVFYLAPALTPLTAAGTPQPLPDPRSPGYHVPELAYAVDSPTGVTAGRLREEGALSDVRQAPAGGAAKLRVGVNRFANGFDRLDLDGDAVPASNTAGRTEITAFAPLLPGRVAVIGTTGDSLNDAFTDTALPAPDEPAFLGPTFTGSNAANLEKRYTTVLSENALTLGPAIGGRHVNYRFSRRFEMIPSPNPDKHQFAVRMNGLTEAFGVTDGTPGPNAPAVNVTVGEGFGPDGALDAINPVDDIPARQAGPPVIAIPIDHFSISEPLDGYLMRQLELDPNLDHRTVPSVGRRSRAEAPSEEYFAGTQSTFNSGADPLHFDEPFDVLPELVENQTTPNYRSLHLERLANPALPWNPPPVRPDGTPSPQHQPRLPVNPYLAVDARSLDLTAFNGRQDLEHLVGEPGDPKKSVNPPGATPLAGPELRHRRRRALPTRASVTIAAPVGETVPIPGATADQAAIGFVSNERDRPLGPFPQLWLYEPARVLWRQSGAATVSEIAHRYAKDRVNGYFARLVDSVTGPGGVGAAVVAYDHTLLNVGGPGGGYRAHTVDFPLRVTLGFAGWMAGETFAGSGLRWFADSMPEAPPRPEEIDIDGDSRPGELVGRDEVTTSGAEFTDTDSDGKPEWAETDLVGARTVTARAFLDTYLRNQQEANDHVAPAFPWPNRPFASAGELLQVPVWGSSRMLTHYSTFNWQHTQWPFFENRHQVNPYNGEAGADVDHDGLDYKPGETVGGKFYLFDGEFGNDAGDENDDGFVDANNDNVDDELTEQTSVPGADPQWYDPKGNLFVDDDGRPEEGPANALRWRETLGHFGHLMNFFQTARYPATILGFARQRTLNGATTNEEYVVPQGAPHFYRLLDYVHTPSRFTATDTVLSPDTFGDAGLAPDDPRTGLTAPFNRIEGHREPGRVNLNTIAGRRDPSEAADHWSEVYDGLMHRVRDGSLIDAASSTLVKAGHLGPAWRDVALSRRGYVQPDFDPTADGGATLDYSTARLHPDFPTLFANPFRAPGEGANVPLAHMVQTGVDATLLRAHPLSPGADGAWGARGGDSATVNRTGDPLADNNGLRNDADEAGLATLELAEAGTTPMQGIPIRLLADPVLAKFVQSRGTSRARGAVPDTLLTEAFRVAPAVAIPTDIRVDGPLGDPRSELVTARVSNDLIDPVTGGANPNPRPIPNAEVSKRSTAVPLFSGASLEPSQNTERNSTTRYAPIQRLANLTTTRSNVYAVWITVGFFEVKQAAQDPRVFTRYMTDNNGDGVGDTFNSDQQRELFFRVYPDGWTLGQELGFDDGTHERHRGFYVVDRSRPVAFRPGEDLNVSDTILVRRRIE